VSNFILESGRRGRNAAESGYSKALISRIENGNVSPSINSLLKIAGALEIKPYDLFLPSKDAGPSVVLKANRKKTTMAEGNVEVEFLTEQTEEKKIEPLLINAAKGPHEPYAWRRHAFPGRRGLRVFQGLDSP